MENPETAMVIASRRDLPTFTFNGIAAKNEALEKAALIGKVTNADAKILAVRAQVELKRVINEIEKTRKQIKEPLLAAGRQLDTLCATESLPLEKEFGRVSQLVSEFDLAELRRVQEEERLQREELARIEAAKQAELKRIADEQAAREAEARRVQDEANRKAREAAEAAAKLAAEATNKKQREAAEAARKAAEEQAAAAKAERERQEAALKAQAAIAAAATSAVEEKAGEAAYVAARPIETTKVAGQRQTTNWVITVTNPYLLAKFHPDCVDIKPRLTEIKAALNEGREIKGIKAVREHVSSVRVPTERKAIDV